MPKAVIVGAGISGLMSARMLIKEGWQVDLVDKSVAAKESTWAGGGILSPMNPWRYPEGVTALAVEGYSVYESVARELTDAGVDPEWQPGGLLSLGPGDLDKAEAWAGKWGVRHEILSPQQARELEPELAEVEATCSYLPDVARIRPPRLGASLRHWVESNGGVIHENAEVLAFDTRAGRVDAVETASGSFSGDVVIVTTGAWTGRLLAELGTQVGIEPIRGQMILYRDAPGLLDRIILNGDRYLIPRADGHMLMGSTLEDVGFDKRTTDEARNELHRVACEMLPALADCVIEHHWSGLRPGKRDHIPVISRHPEHDNLFINAGHYRNGVILSPGSARLLMDLVHDREPWVDPEPYRLNA